MNARAEDARLLITKVYGRHFSISIERLDKRQHDHVADCVWIPVEEVWRATAMMARAKIIASLAPAESGSTDHREGEML
jgi:hypothetical protein